MKNSKPSLSTDHELALLRAVSVWYATRSSMGQWPQHFHDEHWVPNTKLSGVKQPPNDRSGYEC